MGTPSPLGGLVGLYLIKGLLAGGTQSSWESRVGAVKSGTQAVDLDQHLLSSTHSTVLLLHGPTAHTKPGPALVACEGGTPMGRHAVALTHSEKIQKKHINIMMSVMAVR